MRSRLPLALAVILTLPAIAGCLGDKDAPDPERVVDGAVDLVAKTVRDGLANLGRLRQEPLVMDSDVTINVVLVGIDPSLVDTSAVASALPKDYSPEVAYTTVERGGRGALRSGILHNLDYQFHFAPDAWAAELFAQYPALSREVDIPREGGAGPGFLTRYDGMYQLGRAGSGKMHLVDAEAVETWMHEHRADAGLAFDDPEYTVFFLDSWTKFKLWEDSYYWYEFKGDTRGGASTQNMRAWGGTYDFLFMDFGAAPNNAEMENSAMVEVPVCCGVSQKVPAAEGSAFNDPPAWHYDGDTATIGQGAARHTTTWTQVIQRDLDVAVNIRMIGDYAYRPIYKETYYINVHLWHDGRSIIPRDGLDKLLDPALLFPGLEQEIPWAKVTGSIKTYQLPTDDPGMDAALNRAKAEGGGTYVPMEPVYHYIDANKDRYKQNDPEVFDVMALLFLLEGDYTFAIPHIVGGVAFSGPDGTAWGTISSVNDVRFLQNGMSRDYVAKSLIGVNSHEVGHFFGLTHNHDGSRRTANGYEPALDHTWSSTKSVMSYRMRPVSTDTFHRDILARAHTLENLELTLREAESTYRALQARGAGDTPADVIESLDDATRHYNMALDLHLRGKYQDAVVHAIEARRASERASADAGVTTEQLIVDAWTTTGVNAMGVKNSVPLLGRGGVALPSAQFDLRPYYVREDVERLTVRATWSNTPASWGDFFVAWSRSETPEGLVNGPRPFQLPLTVTAGGIHDDVDETPASGEVRREFTLDMDSFPALRRGEILWLGAGTQGNAVNGEYDVDIVAYARVHGDGAVAVEKAEP